MSLNKSHIEIHRKNVHQTKKTTHLILREKKVISSLITEFWHLKTIIPLKMGFCFKTGLLTNKKLQKEKTLERPNEKTH